MYALSLADGKTCLSTEYKHDGVYYFRKGKSVLIPTSEMFVMADYSGEDIDSLIEYLKEKGVVPVIVKSFSTREDELIALYEI